MNILQKNENSWIVEDYDLCHQDNCFIYIKNDFSQNFINSQNKKFFSCGICNPNLQSKIWFSNTKLDYDLACNHIKNIILAQEYSKYQYSNTLWPKYLIYPTTYLDLLKCDLINKQIDNINKLKLDFNIYINYYDKINYIDFRLTKYQVIKNKSRFFCNCKYINNCNHIKNVKIYDKKNDIIINLVLFLVHKYFDSLN